MERRNIRRRDADPTPTALPFTAGGQTYDECTYSSGGFFWVCHLDFGWNYTANQPKAWAMDANGAGSVNVQNCPYALNGDGGVPSHLTNGPAGLPN